MSESSLISRPILWTPTVSAEAEATLAAREAALTERLAQIAAAHGKVKFASSLAAEDMVVTDAIFRAGLPFEVFTLETGRLHADTVGMFATVEARYGRPVVAYAPDPDVVSEWVAANGENAFYDSVDLRKECCRLRKVEPLDRALSDADAWITGQRREQSVTRSELAFAEHDAARGIAKYNPLLDWSEAEVWTYLRRHEAPFNPLHLRGYPSIGCEPCTRAVRAGEDVRAGRWWWENRDTKECGLHK